MNLKTYYGNTQPDSKEFKMWVNTEGIIKTWNKQEWIEQANSSDSNQKWTGHADVEGLKAIGWTNKDIAYYQKYGVNWDEEYDAYHKVPEDNIALYGTLTTNNIADYADIIVYLPKIDISSKTSMNGMFRDCKVLTAIPQLDTSNVTDMENTFYNCFSLKCIPKLDTSNVKNMYGTFYCCYNLTHIPQLNTHKVTTFYNTFYACEALNHLPQLDTSNVQSMVYAFCNCSSLVFISQLNVSNVKDTSYMLSNCRQLRKADLKGLKKSLKINNTDLLEKDSLLYIINNEAATSAITITLSSHCYTKYAEDTDIVKALANHPNISLTK